MPTLFDPIRLGGIDCKNRIFMAPLTRGRATHAHVPTDLMVEYYRQRASAGLIFSEGTGICQQGLGWAYAPGIWNEEQMDGWRKVTRAVHDEGGRIVLQLWHMGRVVHPSFLGGGRSVTASETTAPGHAHTYSGKEEHVLARALTVEEIAAVVHRYGVAARNAMEVGFDGVQVHAANGYLIDQFLRETSNFRRDAYGGSVENRIRLLSEVAEHLVSVVGAELVGVRLSPNGDSQGVNDFDPIPLFTAAVKRLDEVGVAYIEVREPPPGGDMLQAASPQVHAAMREAFSRAFVMNSNFDYGRGVETLARGEADAVSYGRPFIANPNLPKVFREGKQPAKDDMKIWYTPPAAKGYTDYPEI